MILRIVRMEFDPTKVEDFLGIFEESKTKIRASNGCEHLGLCRDASLHNVYFTVSEWLSEDHLNDYRKSELFKSTWAKTKVLFAEKPRAYSLIRK